MSVFSMDVMRWLHDSMREIDYLGSSARCYLESRGCSHEMIRDIGIQEWVCPRKPCHDRLWISLYGAFGECLVGKMMIPWLSPAGDLLGVETRTPYQKDPHRIIGEAAKWQPMWPLAPRHMEKIWHQRRAALVEGIFDAAPLWCVFPNWAIIPCGTAKISRVLQTFLTRWVDELWVLFDNDRSGHEGAEKAQKMRGVQVRPWVRYGRPGDDPGEVWKRGGLSLTEATFSCLSV